MGICCLVTTLLLLCQRQVYSGTINIPDSASAVNGMTQYILYTNRQSWNTARHVCSDIGGRLAKLDTVSLLEKVAALGSGSWHNYWDDMWTGLHRSTDGNLVWDGAPCEAFDLATSTMAVFTDTKDHDEFDDNQQCLRFVHINAQLQRFDCKTGHKFICELTGIPCQYTNLNIMPIVRTQSNASALTCQSQCDLTSTCFLTSALSSSYCVHLAVAATSEAMYEKVCFSAYIDHIATSGFQQTDDQKKEPTSCPVNEVLQVGVNVPIVTSSSTSAPVLEDLCPSTSASTESSVLCSPEYVTLTPSTVSVTVTHIPTTSSISRVTQTQTSTTTVTDILNTCTGSQAYDVITVTDNCIVSTEVYVTSVTSTVVMTTQIECPSAADSDIQIAITPSCLETSVQIMPTTITLYQETPCLCEETSVTTEAFGLSSAMSSMVVSLSQATDGVVPPSQMTNRVISPTLTSFVTSDLQTTTQVLEGNEETAICKSFNLTSMDPAMLDTVIESIINQLTVDTSNLSATIRRKTSAYDPRLSSQSIAITAMVLTLLFLILFLDIPAVVRDFRASFLRVKHTGRP